MFQLLNSISFCQIFALKATIQRFISSRTARTLSRQSARTVMAMAMVVTGPEGTQVVGMEGTQVGPPAPLKGSYQLEPRSRCR
ncbi:hypothetical protein ASF25_21490 [Methylobacterium sp. Leaf100]|nr:hypothetical protein ASF25_21490 [Methylobacterium sp. Leaf100]